MELCLLSAVFRWSLASWQHQRWMPITMVSFFLLSELLFSMLWLRNTSWTSEMEFLADHFSNCRTAMEHLYMHFFNYKFFYIIIHLNVKFIRPSFPLTMVEWTLVCNLACVQFWKIFVGDLLILISWWQIHISIHDCVLLIKQNN